MYHVQYILYILNTKYTVILNHLILRLFNTRGGCVCCAASVCRLEQGGRHPHSGRSRRPGR